LLHKQKDIKMENLLKIELLANQLLTQHNLNGWKFVWDDKPVNRLGQCRYKLKEIALSLKPATILPFEDSLDTLLHEVAHALTPGADHGKVWKDKCVELGCKPSACADVNLDVISPLKGECPTCDAVMYACRKPKSGIICVKCMNADYHATGDSNYKSHIFQWSKNI